MQESLELRLSAGADKSFGWRQKPAGRKGIFIQIKERTMSENKIIIFKTADEKELEQSLTVAKFATVQLERKR